MRAFSWHFIMAHNTCISFNKYSTCIAQTLFKGLGVSRIIHYIVFASKQIRSQVNTVIVLKGYHMCWILLYLYLSGSKQSAPSFHLSTLEIPCPSSSLCRLESLVLLLFSPNIEDYHDNFIFFLFSLKTDDNDACPLLSVNGRWSKPSSSIFLSTGKMVLLMPQLEVQKVITE